MLPIIGGCRSLGQVLIRFVGGWIWSARSPRRKNHLSNSIPPVSRSPAKCSWKNALAPPPARGQGWRNRWAPSSSMNSRLIPQDIPSSKRSTPLRMACISFDFLIPTAAVPTMVIWNGSNTAREVIGSPSLDFRGRESPLFAYGCRGICGFALFVSKRILISKILNLIQDFQRSRSRRSCLTWMNRMDRMKTKARLFRSYPVYPAHPCFNFCFPTIDSHARTIRGMPRDGCSSLYEIAVRE